MDSATWAGFFYPVAPNGFGWIKTVIACVRAIQVFVTMFLGEEGEV